MKKEFTEDKKEAISPISTLSTWCVAEPYDTFNYFLNDYFNKELQRKLIRAEVYNEEELSYLLTLYEVMKEYFENQEDVWKMELKDQKALEIQDLIIKLLSLPSMKRYMNFLRENPYYEGIGDFY